MRSLLRIVAGAAVGGLIAGVVMGVAGFQFVRVDGTAGLLVVAGFVPVVLLTIAIHEAGHVIAGAAVGFRPYVFIVGPLKLERPERRWRIGINRTGSFFGGLSAGIPDSVRDLRKRLIVLIAGGPAASLLGGFVATLLLVVFRPNSAWSEATGVASGTYLLLTVFALMSFLTAFIALVPGRKDGHSSDGAQIAHFLKNSEEVEADVSLTALSLSSLAGRRPREWDQTLLSRALTLPLDSGRGVVAHLLAHIHALDKEDVASAREHLHTTLTHLQQLAPTSHAGILLQAAQFAALYDHDPRAARDALDRARDGMLIASSEQFFTEACVLHAEGRPGVEALLDKAEAALHDSIDRGSSQLRADQIARLREIRRAAEQATETAASPGSRLPSPH